MDDTINSDNYDEFGNCEKCNKKAICFVQDQYFCTKCLGKYIQDTILKSFDLQEKFNNVSKLNRILNQNLSLLQIASDESLAEAANKISELLIENETLKSDGKVKKKFT
jgi:hypothetical protein